MRRSRLTPCLKDFVDVQASWGGTAPMPVREKATKGPVRARHVPSLVPVHTQRAAKPRAFPPTAAGFTAETDSPLEGTGFELVVPPRTEGLREGTSGTMTVSTRP